MTRVLCVVFDSCDRRFVCVVSRWHRVARFPYRVFHSPHVLAADVCRIVAFVSVDPWLPRPRIGLSYSLFRLLRYRCVRSELGTYRDMRDAVLRSRCAVLTYYSCIRESSWALGRLFSFVKFSLVPGNRVRSYFVILFGSPSSVVLLTV